MTSPPPLPTAKPRERTRQILLAGASIVAIVVLVLLVSFSVWRWRLRREMNSRLAEIKAAGQPVNWEDMQRWPVEVPEQENVALIYTQALFRLHEVKGLHIDDLPRRAGAISNELATLIITAVQTNSEALQVAHAITNASRSRYPVNYLDGPAAQLPHLQGLKTLAVALACEAVLQAQEDNPAGASLPVESSLHLSQSLDNEPMLISQLVSSSILSVTSRSLERVLNRTSLPDAQLRQLELEFVKAEATKRLATGLIGERALYNEFLRLAQDDVRKMVSIANQTSESGEPTEMPGRNPGIGWRLIGFFERDRNFFLRAMATNILIAETGPPASLAMTNETDRIEEQARRGFYITSSLLLPSVSGTAVRDASTRASLRAAIVALAIERWRLAHSDSLPGSLDDLVPSFLPAVPTDPFDGKPLRYKPLAQGYVIYSVGMDREDDGGKERPPRSAHVPGEQRYHYDITFIVDR